MNDLGYDVSPEETQDIPLRAGALDESFILLPIKSLMHRKVGTVNKTDSIKAAVDQMTEGGYGCVVVIEERKLIGIFTERDLLTKIVALGVDASTALVGEHMTHNPESLQPDDEVAYALNIMAVGNFRHVPVTDEDHNLIGIFSIRDLQKEVVGHFEKDILNLPPLAHRFPHRRYAG